MKYSFSAAGPGVSGAVKSRRPRHAAPSFTRLMANSELALASPTTSHHCSSLRPGYLEDIWRSFISPKGLSKPACLAMCKSPPYYQLPELILAPGCLA